MKQKPKSLLQTTLELLSSNDPLIRNSTNITPHLLNQTSPNINPPILSSSSRQDNTSSPDDNYDYYHNIITQMNKDIQLINHKLSNIETSCLSSSRITSDPDFLISSRHPKDIENNSNIPSETERTLISKLKQEYETSLAAKNAKMEELAKHNKMLLDKQHELEKQIQAIEENTKATTTTQTNIETETERHPKRAISGKKKMNNDKKIISKSGSKGKSVRNKTGIREKNIKKKGCVSGNVKKKEDGCLERNRNEGYGYEVYVKKLKEVISGNENLDKESLLVLIGMFEKEVGREIMEMKSKYKNEMNAHLDVIEKLKEENNILKNKVNKIKEIAE